MNHYKEKNLIELVKLAQNDDENAIQEIVKRYQNKIFQEFSKLHSHEDSSDLTQEALVKMTKSIKNLKNPEKFNTWIYKIIKNLFYDTLRKKSRNKNSAMTNPINSDYSDLKECVIDEKKRPDENTLSCELKMKINSAIEDLPELFKTIILLREIDGLSYEEIAALTNLTMGTVKSRLARARIKLKKELEPYINNKR